MKPTSRISHLACAALLILLLFNFESTAQSSRVTKGLNKAYPGSSPQEMAMNYITDQWPSFNFNEDPEVWLKHTKTQKMLSGYVVRHRQYYRGLRVDKNEITIKLDRIDRIRMVLNSTFPINHRIDIKPAIDQTQALDIVCKHLGVEGKLRLQIVELMIHVQDQSPHLSYQVNVIADRPTGDWEAFVDAQTGLVLQASDVIINCYLKSPNGEDHSIKYPKQVLEETFYSHEISTSSLNTPDAAVLHSLTYVNGSGYVFSPNPVVSTMTQYGEGPYINDPNGVDDATNDALDDERMLVTLEDITYSTSTGLYKLVGPNAEIVNVDGQELYEQSGANFLFNRSQKAFEAVMCYYHIDRSMRYVNEGLGVSVSPVQYEGGVQYDPDKNDVTNGGQFSSLTGQLYFGHTAGLYDAVDGAEDAFLILHELGHGLHNWLTSNNYSTAEGLSEGLGDYWGQSSTRRCGITGLWSDWEDSYHKTFHWAGQPWVENLQRYTNFIGVYNQPVLSEDFQGQHMSTALMNMRSDLGRTKTDILVLESMRMLKDMDPDMTLQEAANYVYMTSEDLEYSSDERCIIHEHLNDRFNIPSSAPTGGTGDIYIKDTQCDSGDEPNTNSMFWGSRDIWVRNTNDGLLEHQNPDYSQTPNYVYVRVRGNGCIPVTDATLSVYFSKASTSLQWPAKWVNYYITGPNGPILAGDLIETTAIDVIRPGHEQIIEIEWNVPNPNDFNTNNHSYCLLSRIVSASDPMVIYETPDMMLNAQNNNIALKNVTLIPYESPPIEPTAYSLYLGCDQSYGNGQISISSAIHPLDKSIFDYGEIYIELMEPLKSNWIANGKRGKAFTLQTDGRIKVTNESFTLDELPMSNCKNLVIEVTFEPFIGARICAFDVIQNDAQGKIIGGVRYEYRPQIGQTQPPALIQIEPYGSDRPTGQVDVFPNPVNYEINIRLNRIMEGEVHVELYSTSGQLISKRNFKGANSSTNSISVASMSNGLYILRVYSDARDVDETYKLIKQ